MSPSSRGNNSASDALSYLVRENEQLKKDMMNKVREEIGYQSWMYMVKGWVLGVLTGGVLTLLGVRMYVEHWRIW